MPATVRIFFKDTEKQTLIKIDELKTLDELSRLLPDFRSKSVMFIGHKLGNGIRHTFFNTEEVQYIELDLDAETLEALREFSGEEKEEKDE
jgi:hypothetical protein